MKDKIHNDKEKESRGGFTLIEMMIVIAIIGILATLVIRSFVFISNARDSKRISDVRTVQNYLELYYNAVGNYPNDTTWSALTGDVHAALPNVNLPQPVNTNYPYCYSPLTGGSGNSSQPLSYVVGAQLENSNAADTDTADKCGGVQCGNNQGASGKYIYCTTPQ